MIKEILTEGEAVTVCSIVTGLGSGKELCTKDVKRRVKGDSKVEEVKLCRGMKDPGTTTDEDVDAGSTETRIAGERLEKGAPEDSLLTTCSLVTAASVAVLSSVRLLDGPKVPEGSLISGTYPYNPSERDPQCSSGNPGQCSLQESVETVLGGI